MEEGLGTRWVGEDENGHLDKSSDGTMRAIVCVVLSLSCGGGWVAGEGEDKGEGEGGAETRVGEGKNSDGTH